MAKVLIGKYTLAHDEVRIDYAECPRYDRFVDVKAGDYPVYAYEEDITSWCGVRACYVDFGEFSSYWHGYAVATDPAFTPAEGWEIKVEKYISSIDDAEHDFYSIIKTE